MDLNNIELTTRRYILNSAWMNADVRRLKFAEKLVEIARYMTARIMQGYKAIGVRELVDVMNMPEGHASNIQVNYWKNFICTTIDSSMRVKRASIPMFKQTELAYQGKVARWELESEIRKGLEMKENNDE